MIVLLAGLPCQTLEKVLQKIRRSRPEFVYAGLPIHSRRGSIDEDPIAYSRKFSEWLPKLLTARNLESRDHLAICGFNEHLISCVARDTLPSMICFLVRNVHQFGSNDEKISNLANKISNDINISLNNISRCVSAFASDIHSYGSTALLLPPKNFHSQKLNRGLEEFHLSTCPPRFPSRAEFDALRSDCGYAASGGRKSFLSPKGLTFAAPGRYEHGERRPNFSAADHHLPRCWLAAHFRLGVRIRPSFHYDVTPNTRGAFVDCHDAPALANRPTHANIHCNDYVR